MDLSDFGYGIKLNDPGELTDHILSRIIRVPAVFTMMKKGLPKNYDFFVIL